MSYRRLLGGLALVAGVPVVSMLASPAGVFAAPAASGPVTNAPVQIVRPVQGIDPTQSINATDTLNWAGYDATTAHYTSVSASWVQPAIKCSGANEFVAAFWVGLDGGKSGDNSVEQTGTEAICFYGLLTVYAAWSEMYPAAQSLYSTTVDPGDHMSASVTVSGSTYTLTISDATRGWTRKTVKISSDHDATAEVIAEAPATVSGGKITILPLANFGKVTFTGATVNGASLLASHPEQLTMAAANGTVKAVASPISGGRSFSVTWDHS
jgi:Peptidase A4 family